MRILVFGASVTQGFWDSEGGWVNRIRKYYDIQKISGGQNDPPTVFNLGVSGDISSDVVKRFESETKARIWHNEEFLFIFSIGTNNARETNGKLDSTPEKYSQDILDLIQKANKYSKKILFVGLPPCNEAQTNPVSWRSDVSYRNKDILNIEQAMQRVCKKENIPFVPIFDTFTKRLNAGKKLIPDGLHPNDAGHELIASLVKPELEKLLTI